MQFLSGNSRYELLVLTVSLCYSHHENFALFQEIFVFVLFTQTEAVVYSEPCQISKIEHFAKIVNG